MPKKNGNDWASEFMLWFQWGSSSSELRSESNSWLLAEEPRLPRLKNLNALSPPPLPADEDGGGGGGGRERAGVTATSVEAGTVAASWPDELATGNSELEGNWKSLKKRSDELLV